MDWDDCPPLLHCRTEVPHHERWIHWSGPAGSCTGEGLHCCRWYESFSSFSPLCPSFLWLWASVRTYFTAVIYSSASTCHQVWSPHTGLQRAPQTQTCPRYRAWGWEVSTWLLWYHLSFPASSRLNICSFHDKYPCLFSSFPVENGSEPDNK